VSSGTGPTDISERRKLAGDRLGFQCKYYDANDEKFTKPYEWKHCDESMEVGQTYEIHWPHSAAGGEFCSRVSSYHSHAAVSDLLLSP
jgi:Delta carbonic anhydrase